MSMLSQRLDEALTFARQCHAAQLRKGTQIPYLSHPMAVASLVLEFGGGEDEAIAALLHDCLEDGGAELAPEIEDRFGAGVLSIVRECSDSEPRAGERKPPWEDRKRSYLQSIGGKSSSALLVTACDKLHNLTAIVRDYREEGDSLWDRFQCSAAQVCWYYSELVERLTRLEVPPAKELKAKQCELHDLLADKEDIR